MVQVTEAVEAELKDSVEDFYKDRKADFSEIKYTSGFSQRQMSSSVIKAPLLICEWRIGPYAV